MKTEQRGQAKSIVSEYEFKSFLDKGEDCGEVKPFEFQSLEKAQFISPKNYESRIKQERVTAKEKSFKISPIVREHRGINEQEKVEQENFIEKKVQKKLEDIRENAYREGFEKGRREGKEEVFSELRCEVDQKIENLYEMIEKVLETQADLIHNEKIAVYKTIKNLTKWIILRELKDDGEYILRLLEKLINELQTKSNILIQVDPKSFSEMPDILEMIQEKVGTLEKVRLECDYDIEGPGIIIESENGIINGSLKEQFKSLVKLFESVGLKDDENFLTDHFYETYSINEEHRKSSSQGDDDESQS